MQNQKSARQNAEEIVRDAGGQIVGRTRLQKVAYLLELAGLGSGFKFEYLHYGPYSEELADAIKLAAAFGLVKEEERQANWGGTYSIYTAAGDMTQCAKGVRTKFAEEAAKIDSIELELAATAAYLSVEGSTKPWDETARLKPEKAGGHRLENAKRAYKKLLAIETPKALPKIV